MNNIPDWNGDKVAKNTRELLQLERQTEKARSLLTRLQAGLVDAGNKIGGDATMLIEANQQLVLSVLRAQARAETTALSADLDTLTALPNRMLLLDRFAQAIAVAKRRGTCLALLFLDINDFKPINDTFGHGVGDQVLQHVAHCLTGVVRKADTVSRHGGDEFLILLAEMSNISDAILIAHKIHAAHIAPYRVDDQALALTASIGIALYPEHGEDPTTLIERADLAMYHAKRNGLGSCIYNGDEIAGDGNLESVQSPVKAAPYNPAAADPAHRHVYLREANERLIMAAISAQDLQGAAELALQRQAEFLTVLAHELRNPLAPIRMAATLLGHVGSDALQVQELQLLINRQVTRMSRLLDDLFDVARVNSGKLTIVTEVLDINALIHEVINTYAPLVQKRRQQFIVQTPLGEVLIEGDPGRLTQIFSNLLDNASKYTPEGGEIKLALAIYGDTLAITFSDSGIGITAEALPHIFEPFVQDPTATSFNRDGLGIGLTVVRELVEAHKGTVTACSAGSGLGSQFVVTLPLLFVADTRAELPQ